VYSGDGTSRGPGGADERTADLDGDGDVDLYDLATLLASYSTCDADAGFNADADLDGSGCVDLEDLSARLANYRYTP